MVSNDSYIKPLSPDDLLLYKEVKPLAPNELEELRELAKLNVDGFSEQEVCAFIINPIVKILGYRKDTDFSVNLDRTIRFLGGKKRRPDYNVDVWKDNFWLIEAKKPSSRETFTYQALAQAIEYAIHPSINAALVVLCDGYKLEVFDRETDVSKPILHLAIRNILQDIDKLRALLGPWQFWYFQRRRIVRLVDKVFDHEINPERLAEFKQLIETRLSQKRAVVFENFKKASLPDEDRERLKQASVEALVEFELFLQHPIPATNALTAALIAHSKPSSFGVMRRIFSDRPRDANAIYHVQSLVYLMALGQSQPTVPWLPAWLAPREQRDASPDAAVEHLLKHCLTCFEGDEARKSIILAAAAFRRLFRLMALMNEQQWRIGETLHLLRRYRTDEQSWQQMVSSPEGNVIGWVNGQAVVATAHFVRYCQPEQREFGSGRQEFKTEVAKLSLKELWRAEAILLSGIDDYSKLRKQRDLGELATPEAELTVYDQLGHLTLCLMHPYPRWTKYALEVHRAQIEHIAALGSFKAKELLGMDKLARLPTVDDETIAKRFFFGDVEALRAHRSGYKMSF